MALQVSFKLAGEGFKEYLISKLYTTRRRRLAESAAITGISQLVAKQAGFGISPEISNYFELRNRLRKVFKK
jgi:hypothetical protein